MREFLAVIFIIAVVKIGLGRSSACLSSACACRSLLRLRRVLVGARQKELRGAGTGGERGIDVGAAAGVPRDQLRHDGQGGSAAAVEV